MAHLPNACVSSLDLDFNEDQRAIADAVSAFCSDRLDVHALKQLQSPFPRDTWQALAELGVFTPATALGEGGALEICAIAEVLGRHAFPGPLAATWLAAQVLQGDELSAVTEGRALVSLSAPADNLLPFGTAARLFLQTDGVRVDLGTPAGVLVAVETLGAEPWARGTLAIKQKNLAGSERGLLLNHIATAAYLTGAGLQLVKETADYANVRKQFGKTLGEFQGVAHPLADAHISLTAARLLARAAASCFDEGDTAKARSYAQGARLSAGRAALKAAYNCHQVYAGIGITLEGPAFHFTRRIRQLVSQAPGASASAYHLLQETGLGE